MSSDQKVKTTKFILNLARLDESLSDPSLTVLLNNNWEVFSYIPVEDNGPKVILLLKKNTIKNNLEKLRLKSIIDTIILFLILIILSTNTFL